MQQFPEFYWIVHHCESMDRSLVGRREANPRYWPQKPS